jgi:hypothetical protein
MSACDDRWEVVVEWRADCESGWDGPEGRRRVGRWSVSRCLHLMCVARRRPDPTRWPGWSTPPPTGHRGWCRPRRMAWYWCERRRCSAQSRCGPTCLDQNPRTANFLTRRPGPALPPQPRLPWAQRPAIRTWFVTRRSMPGSHHRWCRPAPAPARGQSPLLFRSRGPRPIRRSAQRTTLNSSVLYPCSDRRRRALVPRPARSHIAPMSLAAKPRCAIGAPSSGTSRQRSPNAIWRNAEGRCDDRVRAESEAWSTRATSAANSGSTPLLSESATRSYMDIRSQIWMDQGLVPMCSGLCSRMVRDGSAASERVLTTSSSIVRIWPSE